MRRLRAIAAILGAAAGLDAEQGAKLNLAARVVAAVNALRLPHQFVEWQVEQFRDFLARPVGAGVRHPIASSACARSAVMSSDRKRGVSGKRVSGRVDLGGRRLIKKKKR